MIEFNRSEIQAYYRARTPGMKHVAGKLRAPCPVHDGTDLNFSIDESTGQAYCHSQCNRGFDVISLEMELGGLDFPAAKAAVFDLIGRPMPNWLERDIEATYDYTDESGKLLYQAVRKTGKRFQQRRPGQNGEWIWKLGNVTLVPFNLPALVKAETCYVTEGEKDCLNLIRAGLVATCNNGGAGNFKPVLVPWFTGKHVIILPDNDEPGRKHSEKVAELLSPVAASLRVVRLPGLPDKGDVSDYLAGGKTREDLESLCRDAAPWTPGTVDAIRSDSQAVPETDPADTAAKPANVTSDLAFLAAQALNAKTPDACYSEKLARAMATAYQSGDSDMIAEADAIERKLKARWEKDFSIPHFRKQIKAIREDLKDAARQRLAGGLGLLLTTEGAVRCCTANAIAMMDVLPLKHNSFACRAFLTEESPWGTAGNWTDYDDVKAAEWCQREGLYVEKNITADAAEAVARAREHFHPVVEYLKALKWDGTPRLDNWLHDYIGVPDAPYSRAVAAKWMLSAVKRVMEPGCQADYTLVLEGGQGKRKSTALRTLCGSEWFTDDLTEIGTKDSAMQLQGKWFVEVSELDAFHRAEMTTIKSWLVRREDHFRPPYGRRTEDYPRQNVFAATTNKTDWGQDDTGLRRFWPVRVGKLNIDGIAVARDQLWAEAFFRYGEGEASFLSDVMEEKAAVEQGERQEQDPWHELVTEWVERQYGRIYVQEIMQHCLKIAEKDWNKGHKTRVARILRLEGCVEHRSRRNDEGKRTEYWISATDLPS